MNSSKQSGDASELNYGFGQKFDLKFRLTSDGTVVDSENKKVPIENRVLITGITTSVTVQFFFEPVLTGCRALLFSYLLICGIIRSQLSQY